MSESTARGVVVTSTMVSMFAAVVAIMLGLRGDVQVAATLFLALSVIGSFVSWWAYKRYSAVRQTRWDTELRASEDEMAQAISELQAQQTAASNTPPGEK